MIANYPINKAMASYRGNIIVIESFFDAGELSGARNKDQSLPNHGATATWVTPVSQEDYQFATRREAIEALAEPFWSDEMADGLTQQTLPEYARDLFAIEGDSLAFRAVFDEIELAVRVLGFDKTRYPVIAWAGSWHPLQDPETGSSLVETAFGCIYDRDLYAAVALWSMPLLKTDDRMRLALENVQIR